MREVGGGREGGGEGLCVGTGCCELEELRGRRGRDCELDSGRRGRGGVSDMANSRRRDLLAFETSL